MSVGKEFHRAALPTSASQLDHELNTYTENHR